MPPAIIVQRFCSMAVETMSSHAQVTFMPPGHFAKVIVQRGTITMFMPEEVGAWVPTTPVEPVIGMPGIAIPEHSSNLAEAILVSSERTRVGLHGGPPHPVPSRSGSGPDTNFRLRSKFDPPVSVPRGKWQLTVSAWARSRRSRASAPGLPAAGTCWTMAAEGRGEPRRSEPGEQRGARAQRPRLRLDARSNLGR